MCVVTYGGQRLTLPQLLSALINMRQGFSLEPRIMGSSSQLAMGIPCLHLLSTGMAGWPLHLLGITQDLGI